MTVLLEYIDHFEINAFSVMLALHLNTISKNYAGIYIW